MCSFLLHPDWIHNIWALCAHTRTLHPLNVTPGPACPGCWQRRGLMWHPSLPAQPGTALLQPFLTQQHPRSLDPSPRAQPGSQGYTEGTQEAQAENAMSETCQGSWCISNWACSEGMMSLLPLLWRCRSPRQARGQSYPQTPLAARAGCINKGLTPGLDLQSHSLQPWKSCAAHSHSEVSLCACQQHQNVYA